MRSELPALLGGTPIRPDGPPPWPLPDPDVQTALYAAVASGAWGQYRGEHVCALEAELAAFHGVPHALTCATGTLAVEVGLRALRVGPGDEVAMAAYDYESNFLTVHALGAKPVLVDVRPDNWQLDETKLEAALTPLTKAVLCSHLHGGLVNVPAVLALARPRGVGVIEDAAQAPGAVLDGRPAGTWGDIGTLSFGGSKLLTAGRGGALLFADPALFQRAKGHLNRGVQQLAPLSELQAAALRPQLRKLHEATAWRAKRVRELFQSPPPLRATGGSGPGGVGLPFPPLAPLGAGPNLPAFYKLGLQYDPAAFGLSRELFAKALRAEGVAFDAGFKALHVGRSPSRFRAAGALDHAADAHARCVVLHHPVLSLAPADVRQVAEAVAKVYRYRDELNRPAPTPDPES
ncbi:L-glutamine:2-deoxy-scyllo-inosose aminotransferase [Gemmata obscuriglobus]|uniref:Aminotransferase class V-fold PLP-dependent enzyme n=1 Tax=Gemmata obscuriglobus TaxID=114 RepID=A0A2Z3HI03_9BACT|nr:aminotransferase class V-fold PLP-dependent enzyme [Gemmata obscuriglobus]AWM41080.1 aminotransferase class V-fold PLP-dependent enzyme [Gemmata obscuriglobus]QEG25587.1 L-glutamine:2-deoxy-scyllo-inosose aminotransferase [Gemmata obscuriglobus]VTR99031.1 1 aminotransferase : DegT/DnrJ/EryC1/StrS aminotransferase OS=Planctomyces maris DSM 8797 GN=PM8797T_06100 PE=3 SV=1: DegT_DnrJ_EryC1 [Gemmata obscuriglobus UQM 2246]